MMSAYITQREKEICQKGILIKNLSALETFLDENGNPLKPIFHVTGFEHPLIPVITNDKPDEFNLFHWGLISLSGRKMKSKQSSCKIKPLMLEEKVCLKNQPFRKRQLQIEECIIMVDGFFRASS